MLGRPTPLWILGILGLIGGLICTIVVLQFAEVIPWAGEAATYIGGRWTGVVIYTATAAMFFGAAYGWLTVKPWSSMITILAAIVGFFVPFISHMDGTDPRSSAIAPIIVSVLMLVMVFRPSTNRAMALALSGQTGSSVKAPAPAKPMSAARKRELAEEQAKAAKKATAKPATQAVAVAPTMAATASPAAAATMTAATKGAASAATMVMSAASSIRAAAATPASPRKGVASLVIKQTPVPAKPAAAAPRAPAPSIPAQSRPRGFRADEV